MKWLKPKTTPDCCKTCRPGWKIDDLFPGCTIAANGHPAHTGIHASTSNRGRPFKSDQQEQGIHSVQFGAHNILHKSRGSITRTSGSCVPFFNN